jgi:signal transduction histidine kinase
MSLTARFQLLLAIFGVSVVVNVLVSVVCIHFYIRVASERFAALTLTVRDTEQVRALVDDLLTDLRDIPQRDASLRNYRFRVLHEKIVSRVADLKPPRDDDEARAMKGQLVALASQLAMLAEGFVEHVERGAADEALALLGDGPLESAAGEMERLLDAFSRDSDLVVTDASRDVARQESLVAAVLSGNALLAFLLAAAGVHLVRNWVLKPVGALKLAAEHHAAGDLDYRIAEHSNDELGTLSREINRMADSLIEIQRRLVEQERMAAIGEVASTVAHNIRNPLAGIRASAQSSLADLPEDGDQYRLQLSILQTVDSLSKWLRELLMVSKPITLERRAVVLRDVVESVLSVLAPAAQRRGIRMVVDEAQPGCEVYADAMRLEQAVLSILDNAVEASPTGETVRIEIDRPATGGMVELRIGDRGPGIPPEIMHRVASAYFSTKPGGTGIGLHLAKRTLQAHGGSLEFENDPAGGTRVVVRIPEGGRKA